MTSFSLKVAVDEVPQALLDQLKEGGRLVAVEGQGNAGVARLFFKTTGVVTGRGAFNAAIRPLPGFERAARVRILSGNVLRPTPSSWWL